MTDFLPFSQLLSRATVQALQMSCLTFFRVNWLRNGKSSKEGVSGIYTKQLIHFEESLVGIIIPLKLQRLTILAKNETKVKHTVFLTHS